MKQLLLCIFFLTVTISPTEVYSENSSLAPQSLLSEELVFDFKELHGAAFPTEASRTIFAEWARANNHLIPAWIDHRNSPELNGKPYQLPINFDLTQENEFQIVEDITFSELLQLEQDFYNLMTGNLWTHQDGEWSLRKLLESSAIVLADQGTMSQWGWSVQLQTVALDLARELYRLLEPEKANFISKKAILEVLAHKRQKISPHHYEEMIHRTKIFLFKDAEKDIPKINQIFEKRGRTRLLQLIIKRYRENLIPQVSHALDTAYFRSGIKELDRLTIPNKFIALFNLQEREKTFKRMIKFDQMKKQLDANRKKGENVDRLENEILSNLLQNIRLYIGQEDSLNIREILTKRSFWCIGCSLLGGKILTELGFKVYALNVLDHQKLILGSHIALLVEKHDGSFFLFDAAFHGASTEIKIDENVKTQLKRKKIIDYHLYQVGKEHLKMAANLNFTEEIFETHPRFQILPFVDGIRSFYYNNIGNAYEAQGRLDEAIASYQRALEINPNLAVALYNLGIVYEAQGRLDEVIARYQRALEINPNHAVAWNNLGIAYEAQGRLDEAIACYQRALEINPNYAVALYNLGIVYKAQGRLDEAIARYQRALEINPNYAVAWNNLGIAYKAQGRLDKAIASYQRALEINPNYAVAWNNIGIVYKAQGRLDEAIARYQRALEISPKYAYALNNLRIAYRKKELRREKDTLFPQAA